MQRSQSLPLTVVSSVMVFYMCIVVVLGFVDTVMYFYKNTHAKPILVAQDLCWIVNMVFITLLLWSGDEHH